MKRPGFTCLAKYPDGLIMLHGWFEKEKDRDEQLVKHRNSYPQYEWKPYQGPSYLYVLAFVNEYNKKRADSAEAHQYHIIERGRYKVENPKRLRLIGTFSDKEERDNRLAELRLSEPEVQFGAINHPGWRAAASWVNTQNFKLASK